MFDERSHKLILDAEEAPTIPVWAPNPGVPMLARIFAYLFGALMVLTIIMTFRSPRPPDLPPYFVRWATCTLQNGYMIAYPQGWSVQQHQVDGGSRVKLALLEDSPVRIELLIIDISEQAETARHEEIDRSLESTLRSQLQEYASLQTQSTLSGEVIHGFSFQEGKRRRIAMKGARIVRSQGQYTFCWIAFSPQEGWSAMESILMHMVEGVQVQP